MVCIKMVIELVDGIFIGIGMANKKKMQEIIYRNGDEKQWSRGWTQVGLLSGNIRQFRYNSQVTYSGEQKRSSKFRRWDKWLNFHIKIIKAQRCYRVELLEKFSDSSIIFNGKYENGKKFRRNDPFYKIWHSGSGEYDKTGNQHKQGDWVEISDNFSDSLQTYNGKYKKDIKVSRWDFTYEGDQTETISLKELNYLNYSGELAQILINFSFALNNIIVFSVKQ
ncbi:unnamed protein product [Paramecium octaurelia]|uniref:Uncharacterized protein n=1 Tax=Paramecium octaurelia TaxID=43137 RepID=A0A8S1WI98_PAROT|nr:unnamed protein product [Paramecium octaurelia]